MRTLSLAPEPPSPTSASRSGPDARRERLAAPCCWPGVVLAVALLPIELAFWIGFLLPFAFPFGIATVVLVLCPSASGSSTAVHS